MTFQSKIIFLAVALVSCLTAVEVSAHPLSPRLMTLDLDEEGVPVSMSWREPTKQLPGARPEPRLPEGCSAAGAGEILPTPTAAMRHVRWSLNCNRTSAVSTVAVDGIGNSALIVIARVFRAGELVVEGVLNSDEPTMPIYSTDDRSAVSGQFWTQGMLHLWSGLDHLAVVAGLVVLLGFTRKLIYAVTAFTVGHSITLSAATLGWVPGNLAFTEALIAATVVGMAVEIGSASTGPIKRYPWSVASLIGLVHGLGFANALSSIGISKDAALGPLFAFNMGLELGQLAVIAILYVGYKLAGTVVRSPVWGPRLRTATEYSLGAAGSFWLFQRLGL